MNECTKNRGGRIMDHAKNLSQQLLALRKAKGLTQEALANQLGITCQAISKWENGQSCPDIALLPQLADIYGISIDELFGQEAKAAAPMAIPTQPEPNAVPTFPSNGERPMPGGQVLQGTVPRRRSVMALLLAGLLFILPLALLFCGAFLFGMPRNPSKSFFGYRCYNVLTSSMSPAIKQGDMILVKMCAPETVKLGDIISYSPESNIVLTHRVKQIVTEPNDESLLRFITKGDANQIEDPPVSADRLIGKVTGRLPGVGNASAAIRGHLVWRLLAGLLILLLTVFCWGLAVLIFVLARRKHRGLRSH
jgi:signal peptidase I